MTEARPSQTRSVSLSWLYEAPVFYAALVAFQHLAFPDLPYFHGVQPSPYWIGILLFSLRYGMLSGASTGLLSAALMSWGVREAGESYRFGDADFYFMPGLFLVLGAALGGAADGYMLRIGDLAMRLEDSKDRARGLQAQVLSQQKTMRAVEQQVVSQMSSVVTLYHGSRRLSALERNGLFEAVLDFFTRALQATKTALYLPENGRWVLKGKRGWTDDDIYPQAVDFGQGIIGRAGFEKRPASLRDWLVGSFETGSEVPKEADAIMAAPLLGPNGEPAAVFAVQAMPFLRFNSASLNLLTLLADWGSEAYCKCLEIEQLKARSILDEEYGVHSVSYFSARVIQEFNRSRRYALPYSVLLISPAPLEALPAEKRPHYLHALCRILRETVREVDVVARTPFDDAPFGAIVITATREVAEEVRMRINNACARAGLPAGMRIGVGAFAHTMKDQEELLAQARNDIR